MTTGERNGSFWKELRILMWLFLSWVSQNNSASHVAYHLNFVKIYNHIDWESRILCYSALYTSTKAAMRHGRFDVFFFNFSLENNTSWLFLVLVELKGITKGWKALSLRSDSPRYFLLRCNAWFKYTVMFCSFCWNYYMSVNVTFFSREKRNMSFPL